MSMIVDLHTHSHCSDGSLSPTELVSRAHEQGVQILALTDHDDMQGLPEAQQQADKLGINLISGVEISVSWNGKTIHIVGLGVDVTNEELQQGLQQTREERVRRAKRIAEKLHKCGIENVWQQVTKEAGFEAVTRTHFAKYLFKNGYVKDMQQAFKKFLGRNARAHVNGQWASLEKALGWIHAAGGQAVIAHPIRYKLTNAKLQKLIGEFKQHGGVGIEVVTSRYNTHEKAYIASLARRFDLLASVGSDFHAPGNPYIELGLNLELPLETKGIWEDWSVYREALAS